MPLKAYTRFGIGGPADLFGWTDTPSALGEAHLAAREAGVPFYLLGDGSNVVVADEGFRGLVVRYTADRLEYRDGAIEADSGGSLQALVDLTIDHSLEGMHTLTRIPGSVGGAVYGNAGAYGHQIDEFVVAWTSSKERKSGRSGRGNASSSTANRSSSSARTG